MPTAAGDASIALKPTVQSFDWDEVVAGYATGNVCWKGIGSAPGLGRQAAALRQRCSKRTGFPFCRAEREPLLAWYILRLPRPSIRLTRARSAEFCAGL
jgi:hypothetical protein